ncbi:hypothetical protein MJN85_27725, partial [Salmonella enterica subsp. enterica serovar Anatum]|nr:hypothetical protein [Salmonella enterica subsp. enterica serovar Anatum]
TLGRDVSEAQVWQALETVQLADLARGLSDGLHTHLGEQGNTLLTCKPDTFTLRHISAQSLSLRNVHARSFIVFFSIRYSVSALL